MQKLIDSRIQAQVRILLARRWVDLRGVTIGTTNGVVYIGGALHRTGASPGKEDGAEPAGDTWLRRIHREIAAIPEVRDVVFETEGRRTTEDPWREQPV
jgi:hypothetical protein